jgi:polyferredoxin
VAPARDVLAAEAGMDRRTVRQVRRLMRRGRVAPDVPRARLAVALARDAQRRQSNPLLTAFFAALVVGWIWLFVTRLKGGHIDLLTAIWAGAAAWGIYVLWMLWRTRTSAPQAELRSLRFLQEAGEPYRYEAERGPARVPMPALVTSTLVAFAFYDLGFGALTLAMDGKALSVDRVVGHGAVFAAFMTLFNMTLMRRRNNRQALRSTAGQDG